MNVNILQHRLLLTAIAITAACGDTVYTGGYPSLDAGSSQGNGAVSGSGGAKSENSGGAGGVSSEGAGGASGGATGGFDSGSAGNGQGVGGAGASSPDSGNVQATPDSGSPGDPKAPASPIPADMLAHKWRYVKACQWQGSGVKSADAPNCIEGNNDICWQDQNLAQSSDFNTFFQFAGDPNVVYEIKLRLRGISEPKTYINCTDIGVRKDDLHPMVCDGTGKDVLKQGENFNVLDFRIADPRQDFYMNNAPVDEPHRVEVLDQEFTIKARGQTKVNFRFDDLNGGEIRNCPRYTFKNMPDMAPYDNTAIDGQFWQWDCADPNGKDSCWKVSQ